MVFVLFLSYGQNLSSSTLVYCFSAAGVQERQDENQREKQIKQILKQLARIQYNRY
jgi:hypothetical protein